MKTISSFLRLSPIVFCALWSAAANASTLCTVAGCSVTIAADPNAAQGNFQSPGSTANVGYSINTSDDGTDFLVTLTTTDLTALPFANLYFDTIGSTPNTGSNLGFEFSQNSQDAFDPNTSTKFDLTGTGVSSLFTVNGSGTEADISIPNSFFLNNPLSMPFAPTPDGTLVSLHLSQSFSYSVVGGGGNFAAPVELGDAIVSDVVAPEPSSFLLLGFGSLGILWLGSGKLLRRPIA